MIIRAGATFSAILLGVGFLSPQVHAAASCESLRTLALPKMTITEAHDSCRVAATLQPTSDSEIKVEVWLPASGWNGKLLANGKGGWSGSIRPETLGTGLRRGYATAMTDTGHQGSSASFALGHPEKLTDFGYRAAHEMAVAARAIVTTYYGRAPRLSYWSGCSAGGRQGLMEAQRFPEDFDGIIAGAPGLNWTGRAIQSMAIAQAVRREEGSYLPPAKYAVLHQAVLEACDARDGVKDGVLEDPTRCRFDPKELQCEGADGPGCLTAAQVEAARSIYSPGFSVSYYQSVLEALGGASKVQGSVRLFMVPGMAHCGGGQGTSRFDMLDALERWVEQGEAPDRIAASRVRDGKEDRTRPLCPYPQVAVYRGTGSVDDAANFACQAP